MFVVTEEDEAAIRAVYEQRGEFAAAIELRQRFPGILDNAQARGAEHFPAGLEVRHCLLVHLDRLVGARIAPDTGGAMFHCEGAEPTQFDAPRREPDRR